MRQVRKLLFFFVLLIALLIVLTLNIEFPGNVGKIDFRAYWSASYLLGQGENFSDATLLTQTERKLTGFRDDFLFATWNPPWLLVLLLPYTLVSFEQAVWWWVLTNIILIFVSSILIWRMNMSMGKEEYRSWIAPLVAFTFSSTLIAIIAGQVNILVLAGLALFLFLLRKHPLWAGVALVLTLVKPHLVYLALPFIFLKCWREKHYRVFIGFSAALGILIMIVFFLRPSFIGEYLQNIGGGNLSLFTPPSLGGMVQLLTGNAYIKWSLLLILPVLVILFWTRLPKIEMKSLVEGLVVLSFLTLPFGWSYDFVVLLLPLLFVFAQIVLGRLGKWESGLVLLIYVVANGISYIQRITTTHEAYYVWLTIIVALLYFWVSWRTEHLFRFETFSDNPRETPLPVGK